MITNFMRINNVAAKNSVRPRKNTAEGGCGDRPYGRSPEGREFRLARAEAKPRRPARQEQNPTKKFSFPFRRKNRGGAN